MKSILITGCSSGFGLETARYFLERDWKVIASMRNPREDVLPRSDNLVILSLDLTDPQSIDRAVADAGPIDALVNNAGIGARNAAEGFSMAEIREIFETNTFGTMAMTRAVLPGFRQRASGVVVNITSAVTLKAMPFTSVYAASKAAVNAYSESLALEVKSFGVRVHLVIPGRAPETRFGDNVRARTRGDIPDAYAELLQQFVAEVQRSAAVTHASDVVEAVWRAVNDPSCPTRLVAGADAVALTSS